MNIKKQYKGIFYIILSAFCFSLMDMFVRMSGDLPSIQKSFFRNIVAAVFGCILVLKEKGQLSVEERKREVSDFAFHVWNIGDFM